MILETYFDHASTCYPKPPHMLEGMVSYLDQLGVSPGRSSYLKAQRAEEIIFATRGLLAQLFNAAFAHNIIFTLNATHALNIIIQGLLQRGDHVITTNLEHNAVLRPLENLKNRGIITYDIIGSDENGTFDVQYFQQAIKDTTRLIIVNHGSNVLGSLAPIDKIGLLAKKNNILFAVDASQTAGLVTIDVQASKIDFLAFTAHKSLMGPSGVGGLYISDSELLTTLYQGGTGSNSILLSHPELLPTKFEAGTMNYMGIAGLQGSLQYLTSIGQHNIYKEKIAITHYCLYKLLELPQVIIQGNNLHKELPIISFFLKSNPSAEVSYLLDKHYAIMTRSGLHCAPLVHKKLNTLQHGTVRLSFGYQNTYQQVDYCINALKNIIKANNAP